MEVVSIEAELEKVLLHPEHPMTLPEKRGLSDECNMIKVYNMFYWLRTKGKVT
jgi:hypothetical protein